MGAVDRRGTMLKSTKVERKAPLAAQPRNAASCLSRRQMDSAESAPCSDAGVVVGQRTVRSDGRGLAYAIPESGEVAEIRVSCKDREKI